MASLVWSRPLAILLLAHDTADALEKKIYSHSQPRPSFSLLTYAVLLDSSCCRHLNPCALCDSLSSRFEQLPTHFTTHKSLNMASAFEYITIVGGVKLDESSDGILRHPCGPTITKCIALNCPALYHM
ncbi:hypothetical protein Tcan_00124 [Toxocara canis]|uniref:Uncharacterized protein n=1 Tax=Toxocara canis TaxID=6265 RepID=A0A0B2W0U3_TOXCA|nr:hypothetical protein Tcan_00124 [Toxocara canis]